MKLSKLGSITLIFALCSGSFPVSAMERKHNAQSTAKDTSSSAAAAHSAPHRTTAPTGGSNSAAAASVAAACSVDPTKTHSLDPDDELDLKARAGKKDGDAAATTISAAAGAAVASQPQKYILELVNEFGNQKLEFDAKLIRLSALLTDMAHNNNKADAKNKSNVISLPAEHIKISLTQLHDVLSIIADPTKRPMRKEITNYLTGKNIFDFCTAAHFLGIENLENIITELLAKDLMRVNFNKALAERYKKLPDEIQYSISSHIINDHQSPVLSLCRVLRPKAYYKHAHLEDRLLNRRWSPDTAFLTTFDKDQVKIMKVDDGTIHKNYKFESSPPMNYRHPLEIKWSPNGTQIACYSLMYSQTDAGASANIHVWDTKSCGLLASYPPPGNIARNASLAFDWSSDGSKLATYTYFPNACYVLNAKDGEVVCCYSNTDNNGSTPTINDIKYSPDGNNVASCYSDGTVHIWDPCTGLRRNKNVHTASVNSLDWAPNNATVVSAAYDGSVYVWDASNGKIVTNCSMHNYLVDLGNTFDKIYADVKFSHDRKYIAIWTQREDYRNHGYIYICNAHDGTLVTSFLTNSKDRHNVAWTKGSNTLNICFGKEVCILDINDRLPPLTIEELLGLIEIGDTKHFFEVIQAQIKNSSCIGLLPEDNAIFYRLPKKIRDYILRQFTVSRERTPERYFESRN